MVGRFSSVHFALGASLYFGVALVTSVPLFMAVGGLTSQVAPTRRRAAGSAAVVLGVSYGLRMVGDSGTGLHVLVWMSPLGWIEELKPLVGTSAWALLPIAAMTFACAAGAVFMSSRRDLGASVVTDSVSRPPHLRLLSGSLCLTVRLTRSSSLAWVVAIGLTGFLMGLVAKAARETMSGSSVQQVFERLGSAGHGTTAYLGVSFLMVAVLAAFMATSSLSATRQEEAGGLVDMLVAARVSRTRFLCERLAVATLGVAASGLAVGLLTWLGTVIAGAGVSLSVLLLAGLNVVPPAFFLLGAGALVFGLSPRRCAAAAYAVLVWSILVELLGGLFPENHWLVDTSLFHQMASAPAVSANWQVNAVMLAAAAAFAAAGVRLFRNRDLVSE